MSIAELKILNKKADSKEVDESRALSYIDSFHPAVLRLLANDKLNHKRQSPKAYRDQQKITFKCAAKLNLRPNSLLNKKVG